jgi:hypothetical protein
MKGDDNVGSRTVRGINNDERERMRKELIEGHARELSDVWRLASGARINTDDH